MLKSKAAWLASRPGGRWRTVTTLKATGVSGFSKLKFQGGYFLAASGGVIGATNFVSLRISNNLVNWDVKNTIGAVTPPVIDVACDGIYAYMAYVDWPGQTRIERYDLSSGVNTSTTVPYVLRTLDARFGSTLFYTYVGGYGYISSWPTKVNISGPAGAPKNPIGFTEIPGTNNAVFIDGIIAGTIFTAYGTTSATNVLDLGGWGLGGTAINPKISPPVVCNIQRTPKVSALWAFMDTGTSPTQTRLRLYAGVFTAPPFVVEFNQVTIGATYNFGTVSAKTPLNIVSSDSTGELLLAFDDGEIWRTKNFGTTWDVPVVFSSSLLNMIFSNKGLVVAATDGTLYVSP